MTLPPLSHPLLPVDNDTTLEEWAAKIKSDGGFTVSPWTGEYITSGYAVSVHAECERVVAGEASPTELRDYVWTYAAALSGPDAYVGAWVHNGKTYLDVSTVVSDRAQAARLGRAAEQIAAWDITNAVEITL